MGMAVLVALAVTSGVDSLPVPRAARAATIAQGAASGADDLQKLAGDFWAWRDRNVPFNGDDVPRIPRPAPLTSDDGRDWSAGGIASKRRMRAELEARWKAMNSSAWRVPQQVDYQLLGSAIARVRWELDLNREWRCDPDFYLSQSLGALVQALVEPPPFDPERSRTIRIRMEEIPALLESGKANLQAAKPFAKLAIDSLHDIGPQLRQLEKEVGPMLAEGNAAAFHPATEKAIAALESYRDWLDKHLSSMPERTPVGRENYEFFLSRVALQPYTPEEMLRIARQEWERTVAFEQYEKQRKFLVDRGILSVPPEIGHYTVRALPGYLMAISDFGEMDSFLGHTGVRYLREPSPELGYFDAATARDQRPLLVHEGVPGHFFQLALSRMHEDPIRRHYYDSGPIEGIGFYAEEMMLQAGLFDDRPRVREIIYNFMRLRALRVEVDVKLALGTFTIPQAAAYLHQYVPMDARTSLGEAAAFATGPGQAITYQIGKTQILRFLADAKVKQGDAFQLQAFHDYLWKNGNVPLVLQRWEYLGLDDDWRVVEKRRAGTDNK